MASNKVLSGHNIYRDDRNRYVLYDTFSKAGYVVNQNHVNQVKLYSNRYLVAILIAVLIVLFDVNYLICIGVGVVVAAFLEFKYRQFLNSLAKLPDFKKPDQSKSLANADMENKDKGKCLLLFGLYLLFAILLVYNGYISHHPSYLLVLEVIVSVVSLVFAIRNLLAFLKK